MKFTKVTSTLPEKITKRVELVDGVLKKTAAASMVEGKAEMVAVSSLTEFAQELMQTDSSTAFVYGLASAGDCKLVTKAEFEKRGRPKGYSPRTNEAFRWNAGPSIMFLDYDCAAGEVPMSKEELIQSLEHACKGITSAGYIVTTSASANILDGEGNDLTGVSGQRVYLPVQSGLDIPRAAKVLEERLWLSGQGRIEISKSGAMLTRSLFDFAVYQPSRLDFVGAADLVPPLHQRPKLPQVVDKGQLLDTTKIIKHDLKRDAARAKDMIEKAKVEAKPESDRVMGDYIDHRAERESEKFGVPLADVKKRLTALLKGGELNADFLLYTRAGTVTVAEVMANPEQWDRVQCLSPGEEDYRGGDYCGIIHADDNPMVFSLAHGGMSFPFAKEKEAPTSSEPDAKGESGAIHAIVDNKGGSTFLMENKAGNFVRMNPALTKRKLVAKGMPEEDAEAMMDEASFERPIVYAGPVSGMKKGSRKLADQNILVTTEMDIPEAKAGDWQFLYDLIDGMFPDDDNKDRFMAWLYHSWKSLKDGVWSPLPVLCLGGPKGCGKTLTVTVANMVLGEGTVGKAFRWASGGTNFNAEMLQCNLLEIDDEISSTQKGARDAIGATFKQIAVVGTHAIEAKGVQSFTCPTFWRMVVCCNDEPESLKVLPVNNDGLQDKYLLLRAVKPEVPVEARTGEEREALRQKIRECIPGFLHYMQEADWSDTFADGRMIVTGWQDDQLMKSLNVMTPAAQLLELVDLANPYSEVTGCWEGKAMELQQLLANCDATKMAAHRVLSYATSCGIYLSQLAKSVAPDRVESAGVANGNTGKVWRIYPDQS